MKIIYHNDFDGKCSAAIAYLYYGNEIGENNIEFIEADYNKEIPLSTFKENEKIIILDFSFSEDFMNKLLDITTDIIWIDHHKTSIEKFKNNEKINTLPGLRLSGTAACPLSWHYFFYSEKVPDIVKYIADYDVWTFEYDFYTEYVQEGLKTYDTDPDSLFWVEVSDDLNPNETVDRVIDRGRTCLYYRDSIYNKMIGDFSFETELEGYSVIALNTPLRGSPIFGDLKDEYDIMSVFCYNGEKWTVSLYTVKDDIDVSEITERKGGGGHKQAAGFVSEYMPEFLKGENTSLRIEWAVEERITDKRN